MEEKYLRSIESHQEKIKDLESQMVKEKRYLLELKQIFEEHDNKQIENITQLDKTVKIQEEKLIILKKKLKTHTETDLENPTKPAKDSQTQTDSPSFTPSQLISTPVNLEILLLKQKYNILEEKLVNLEVKLKNNSQGKETVSGKKYSFGRINHTTSRNQTPRRQPQNKFSVSLQVKRLQEVENNISGICDTYKKKKDQHSNQMYRIYKSTRYPSVDSRQQTQSTITTGRVCQTPTQKQSTTTTTGRVCQTPTQKQSTTTTTGRACQTPTQKQSEAITSGRASDTATVEQQTTTVLLTDPGKHPDSIKSTPKVTLGSKKPPLHAKIRPNGESYEEFFSKHINFYIFLEKTQNHRETT